MFVKFAGRYLLLLLVSASVGGAFSWLINGQDIKEAQKDTLMAAIGFLAVTPVIALSCYREVQEQTRCPRELLNKEEN